MTRTAICFYGLIGSQTNKAGVGKPLDVSLAGNYNIKNIIENNNADVFIHSWSANSKEEIVNFYNPTSALIEPQANITFPTKYILNRPIYEKLSLLKRPKLAHAHLNEWRQEAYRACSRWLSTQKVVNEMRYYEKTNNFEYDAVLLTRLDVGFFTDFNFVNYDLSRLWVSNWNSAPKANTNNVFDYTNRNREFGFLDLWFLSNSANIRRFANIYDNLFKLSVSPHRSSYEYAKLLKLDISYCKYRWQDYEMVRRVFFEHEE